MESRIRERAAYCLQNELNDPRAGLVTITKVVLAQDISSGQIFYSTLGDESDRNKIKGMLASASGFIQRQVARVLEVRNMPRLTWIFDDTIERASGMSDLIGDAIRRDDEIRGEENEVQEDA